MIQFRDDVERMSKDALIAYIGNLEAHITSHKETVAFQAVANLQRVFGVTKSEAALLVLLSDGLAHTKEGILQALYAGRIDESPEIKIIDVYVCKVRAKIAGTGIVVDTIWGTGYRVSDPSILKLAMAGQMVERDDSETKPRVGKPVAGVARAHGSIMDMALVALRDRATDDGVVSLVPKELGPATDHRASGSDVIRRLEARGDLVVLRKPKQRGGLWRLRLAA